MCSSKTAYEGVASCWRSPGYLLTETFELLLCTFVILDHRCLACVIIQQSSHLMRKMSSILLSTIKAVKNISAICNVPSAAASMNLTGNNMKFTVEHIFKKWKLVRLPLAFTKPPLKAAQTTPQSHGRTPHLDFYSSLPADLLTFCVFPIRLPHCYQNYLLNLRPGYMSHYLKALCGIPSSHHCQLECSVTQPPAPGCPPAPTGLILSRLGHWLLSEVTIPLPTLHVVSEEPCFSPLFCVATPLCPTTLTSNVTCSCDTCPQTQLAFCVCAGRNMYHLYGTAHHVGSQCFVTSIFCSTLSSCCTDSIALRWPPLPSPAQSTPAATAQWLSFMLTWMIRLPVGGAGINEVSYPGACSLTLATQNLAIRRAVFISRFALCTLVLSPPEQNNSPVSQRAIDSDKNSPFRQWVHLFLSHSLPQTAGSLYKGNVASLRSHTLRSL